MLLPTHKSSFDSWALQVTEGLLLRPYAGTGDISVPTTHKISLMEMTTGDAGSTRPKYKYWDWAGAVYKFQLFDQNSGYKFSTV